ncbi:MAG TPA: GNAT family protein [Polyangiaceae bacterium]|nr:GNAT family protein [Polyangiaceae bacterium]
MRLRELRREDLTALNQWRNDRDVANGLGNHFAFIGPEVDAQWFAGYLSSRDRNVRLAILDDDDELAGCAYLLGISWVHRSAEFAIMIGRKQRWGSGLGGRATQATLDHAFFDLQLHRVWLHVNRDNERARRMYERAGFRHEGTLRSAVYKNGRYVDVDVMAILAGERSAQPQTT